MNKYVRDSIISTVTLCIEVILIRIFVTADQSGMMYSHGFSMLTVAQFGILSFGTISFLFCCAAVYNCLRFDKFYISIIKILFITIILLLPSAILLYVGLVLKLGV